MLLALAGVSSAAMAQQKPVVVEQVDIIQVQDKYQVITNPFWSNWFFSIGGDRKSTRLNSSHIEESRMPSSA